MKVTKTIEFDLGTDDIDEAEVTIKKFIKQHNTSYHSINDASIVLKITGDSGISVSQNIGTVSKNATVVGLIL